MKNKTTGLLGVSALFVAMASGCGGTDDTGDADKDTLTGYMLDSAVEGVAYSTSTQSGYTGQDGAFKYQQGETVSFSIGAIELGSTSGAERVTPLNLAGTSEVSSQRVQNTLRLLQTLDSDNNPGNGITIDSAIRSAATDAIELDVAAGIFESDFALADLLDATSKQLVDAATSTAHFQETLTAYSFYGAGGGEWNPNEPHVLVFYPDNTYFQWTVCDEWDEAPEIERGSFTYTEGETLGTGTMSNFQHLQDGCGGFDSANGEGPYEGTISVNVSGAGARLIASDFDVTFPLIRDEANPIVGAWSTDSTLTNNFLLLFHANGYYFQWQPNLTEQIEIGRYVYDKVTSTLTVSEHIREGDGGLDPVGARWQVTITGDEMEFVNESLTFYRIQ